MDKFKAIVNQWCGAAGNNETFDTLKAMEVERLDRIAEALEGIENSLGQLGGCVDDAQGYGKRLCITGTVTNYEG